jgi:hypothetical protein
MANRISPTADQAPDPTHPALATVDNLVLDTRCADGVALESLEPGSVVRVSTQHSVYQFLMLDPSKRHVLAKGGTPFPDLTEARIEGATDGGSLMKAGWVGVGFRVKMSVGNYRVLTSPVTSVTVEDGPIA